MVDIDRRHQKRVPIEGTLRLLVKGESGFLVGSGEITDLSASGCAIRVSNRTIAADLSGRIEVAIEGLSLSLPITTRWVRAERDGWIVGCAFGNLTPDDHRDVQTLLRERSGFLL
jgi:hypothetical protein